MKQARIVFFTTLLISIVLFVLGLFTFTPLFEFFEPHVEGILLQVTELGQGFRTSILFSLLLALIPFALLFIWRRAPILSLTRKIASIVTIVAFIAIAICIRHQAVKTYFTLAVKKTIFPGGNQVMVYPIDPINFVYYMFVGLCIGCIFSYFLYRQK